MKSRKLKTAPSFNCRDMQKAVDNICNDAFENEAKARWARIYFYRTRLMIKPDQVAAIFNLDQRLVNSIAMEIGRNKSEEIKRLEHAISMQFRKYHVKRYEKHVHNIVNRINNRTLVPQ